ncbi:MAG: transposase [Rhodospirillaceae bacterium]|nr:transposase [Rhodospirillaceae bacterium]
MARLARLVVPGQPHHVIQRGVRRMTTFFSDDDYRAYLDLVAEGCGKAGTMVWAYCLMPNHVHLILVPETPDGLRAALGEAHRRYTQRVNLREGWRGYLWQGRFQSFVMDEAHLAACTRYIEVNPVRAGLVAQPEDWPWSSARAHLDGRNDALVRVRPLLRRYGSWRHFLGEDLSDEEVEQLRRHGRTGRPCGGEDWIEGLERETGRSLKTGKPGPKPRPPAEEEERPGGS